jgi:TctA family transporter
VHVFPRYAGDRLYGSVPAFVPAEQRREYAERLRSWFERGAVAAVAGPEKAGAADAG